MILSWLWKTTQQNHNFTMHFDETHNKITFSLCILWNTQQNCDFVVLFSRATTKCFSNPQKIDNKITILLCQNINRIAILLPIFPIKKYKRSLDFIVATTMTESRFYWRWICKSKKEYLKAIRNVEGKGLGADGRWRRRVGKERSWGRKEDKERRGWEEKRKSVESGGE